MINPRNLLLTGLLSLFAVAIVIAAAEDSQKTGISTLPEQVIKSEVIPMMSPVTGDYGLAKPIKRIVNPDGTCAGVVRVDGNKDGECPAEAANLPTVEFNKVLPFEGEPLD